MAKADKCSIEFQSPMIPENTKIALLAGGSSGERPISLKSAEGAKEALTEAGYDVTQFDPAEPGDLKALIDGDFDVAFLALHGKGGEDGAIQGFLETIGLPYTCSGIWGSAVSIDKTKAKVFYREFDIPTPARIDRFARGRLRRSGHRLGVGQQGGREGCHRRKFDRGLHRRGSRCARCCLEGGLADRHEGAGRAVRGRHRADLRRDGVGR